MDSSVIVDTDLRERDRQYVWHPFSPAEGGLPLVPIVRGEGAWLVAEDGRRYLDMVSSWWVNLHGHAHPYMAGQIARQASTLEHVIFAGFTHAPAVTLCERLLPVLPGNMAKAFFTDDGSTAVEVALKIAIQYFHNRGESKRRIIAFQEAYHGDTFGAMSVGGRGSFTAPFQSYLFEVDFIEPPLPGREEESIRSFTALLEKHDDIAAFIYEPLIQGTAGMRMYAPEPLDTLLRLCRDKGILAIADEVMTGFGRTGKLFAGHYLQEGPDLICLSKGLTGGTMPMGLTCCTSAVFDAFRTPDRSKMLAHGHSYTANPLACAAALASLDLLLSDECQAGIQSIMQSHAAFARSLHGHPALADIRCLGTVVALELNTAEGGYYSSLRDYFYTFFLEKGLLLRPLGNILYLIPPYCISGEELELAYTALRELLAEYPFVEK